MSAFEPIINLLVVLTALSVAAERLTNAWKLRNPVLRDKSENEKEREGRIGNRTLIVGIVLALVLKANLLTLLAHIDAPWDTLGWIRLEGSIWQLAPETDSPVSIGYAILGSLATGAALGFGSKFWHDILDTVLELRNNVRRKNQ